MTFALFHQNNQDFFEFHSKTANISYDFCNIHRSRHKLQKENMEIAWFPYDFLRIPKINMHFFAKSLRDLANRLAIWYPEIAQRLTIA